MVLSLIILLNLNLFRIENLFLFSRLIKWNTLYLYSCLKPIEYSCLWSIYEVLISTSLKLNYEMIAFLNVMIVARRIILNNYWLFLVCVRNYHERLKNRAHATLIHIIIYAIVCIPMPWKLTQETGRYCLKELVPEGNPIYGYIKSFKPISSFLKI